MSSLSPSLSHYSRIHSLSCTHTRRHQKLNLPLCIANCQNVHLESCLQSWKKLIRERGVERRRTREVRFIHWDMFVLLWVWHVTWSQSFAAVSVKGEGEKIEQPRSDCHVARWVVAVTSNSRAQFDLKQHESDSGPSSLQWRYPTHTRWSLWPAHAFTIVKCWSINV